MRFEEIKEKEREKTYLFGELEKLSDDKDYYMKSIKKTEKFISENSELLNRIKKINDLDKKEKWKISKTLNLIKKLSKIIK